MALQMNPTFGIRYYGTFDENGVGYATRGTLEALRTLGIGPSALMFVQIFGETNGPAEYRYHEAHAGWKEYIAIVHGHPMFAFRDRNATASILHTYWETSKMPQSCVDAANGFDEVWVPSNAVRDVLLASGVTKPVIVIPHVLQGEVYKQPLTQFAPLEAEARMRFFFNGSTDIRKNPEVLLAAYAKTGWQPWDSVNLHLHFYQVPSIATQYSADRDKLHVRTVHDLFASASKAQLPSVSMDCLHRKFADLLNYHAQCHTFVTASRGEAFGYDAVIAAALGRYVIAGYPAIDDLAAVAPQTVRKMESRLIPVTRSNDYAYFDIDQDWWHSSIDTLRDAMKAIAGMCRTVGGPPIEEAIAVRSFYSAAHIGSLIRERSSVIREHLSALGGE